MILITGGGTGGHLASAKAVAEELKNMGEELVFVGSERGQDRAWFEESPLFSHKYFLPSSGVVDKRGLAKIASLMQILKGAFACGGLFRRHKIDKVISVGGYSAAAASIAAVIFKRRLFICEQNAAMGRLNSLLRGFAVEVFSAYEEGKLGLGPYAYPVQSRFFEAKKERGELKNILFLGGSQGARFINDLAIKLAPKLSQMGIKITHQCGVNDEERVKSEYKKMGVEAEIIGFCVDLDKKMAAADLAVSRSGAGSLWELVAAGLPSIFVPFRYAAGDHQYYNAKFLVDSGLAVLFREEELTAGGAVGEGGEAVRHGAVGEGGAAAVLEAILKMDIAKTSRALDGILTPDGAKKIAQVVLAQG